jgi:hypothetical protein
VQFAPPPEAACIAADPLFVNPATDPFDCDFHLGDGSPCIGSGDPPGTDMGAYSSGPSPVAPASWGRIKSLF